MPGTLWAGERKKHEPRHIAWEVAHADFHFSLTCGLSPADENSCFRTDPDIKSEAIRLGGAKGRIVAERKGPMVRNRTSEGSFESFPLPIHSPESMISELRDGNRFPALSVVRNTLAGWRFYHQFRTDPDSPVRRAQVGSWSPVLDHHSANLAAAWQSIAESGFEEALDEAIEDAFPGSNWRAVDESGWFQFQLSRPGLNRWLNADELSDGTLRFLCLVAALLTPKPPSLLVFNEPESSLHPGLLQPLAQMVAKVPMETQIIIVTHSEPLATSIAELCGGKSVRLISHEGETRLEGQGAGRRVWIFED